MSPWPLRKPRSSHVGSMRSWQKRWRLTSGMHLKQTVAVASRFARAFAKFQPWRAFETRQIGVQHGDAKFILWYPIRRVNPGLVHVQPPHSCETRGRRRGQVWSRPHSKSQSGIESASCAYSQCPRARSRAHFHGQWSSLSRSNAKDNGGGFRDSLSLT